MLYGTQQNLTNHKDILDLSFLHNLHSINSSPPGQNGFHLADSIFKCTFMDKKFCILIQISLKFIPKGRIDNKSALAQVMAWRWTGDKPLPQSRLT